MNKLKIWIISLYILALIIFVLGSSYASVPLYKLYCQTSGFGGLITKDIKVDYTKNLTNLEQNNQLTVHFNCDTSKDMPWDFKPLHNHLNITVGDTVLAFYRIENTTDDTITGISTYNITPPKVGIYFNKIQCFCFEEQNLKPHEKIEMPVLFYIDSDFQNDPKMNDVKTITLSYTFFRCN